MAASPTAGDFTAQQPPGPGPVARLVGLLAAIAALVCYGLAELTINDTAQQDAAGHGLAAAMTFGAEALVWIFLGAFLIAAARRSGFGPWFGVLMAALWLAGGWASLTIVDAWTSYRRWPQWLALVPTLAPLVIAALGAWIMLSTRRSPRARIAGIGMAAAAIIALFGLAQMREALWEAAAPDRAAQAERNRLALEQSAAESNARDVARLRSLGPDSRLDDLVAFMGTSWEEEALATVRTLHTRQSDAERLLAAEETNFAQFRRLGDFGLQATPRLCVAYRGRSEWVSAYAMEEHGAASRWLLSQGCDLRPQIIGLRDDYLRRGEPEAQRFRRDLDALLTAWHGPQEAGRQR